MKEYMTHGCITKNINASIIEIAKCMKEFNIGFIPITKENTIMGIITDRDLVIQVLANKDNKIEPYLQRNIYTVEEEESVQETLQIMRKNKVKRLLVTKGKKVIGVIALSDLLKSKDPSLLETIKTIFSIENREREQVTEIDAFYL